MNRILKHLLFFFFLVNFFNTAYCSEYFQKGVELFNNKKYEDAKFMFERSIVFDPKNSNQSLSHEPLKLVCPVKKTLLFFQNLKSAVFKATIFSRVLLFSITD